MPNNKCENRLLNLLSAQEWHLDRIYAEYARQFGSIFREFNGNIKQYQRKELEKVLGNFNNDLENTFASQIRNSFGISDLCNDELAERYLKGLEAPEKEVSKIFSKNPNAASAFLARKAGGFTLSQRVWNLTQQTEAQLTHALETGIFNGRSASDMARDLKSYLKEPNQRFRRLKNADGKLVLSNPAKNYNPGQGVYRSSYKNALRLSRNEINIAYRTNDFERRKNMPFVMGYRVRLSAAHPQYDLCDELIGNYPKTFKFVGWHPNCYSDDTEVLTDYGWKFFKDLDKDDLIFSLNPETRVPEFVGYKHFIKKTFKGDMISFKNRSLDMLVTPDHPMKYINKGNGRTIEECRAEDYRSTKGGLYRSSEYKGEDVDFITIGEHRINFDLFAEFMAYYLSEGSLSWTRKNQFHIAQCKEKHNDQYLKIKALLSKMPFKFSEVKTGFYLRDETMYEYLRQFGKSKDKHVPSIILDSSKRQIEIFLDAYVICDGHTRTHKSFIGNRGTKFTSKKKERSFFTSSELMAGHIGEMIIKIGKRPSYRIQKSEGKTFKHRNGNYTSNKDIIRIAECHSQTATVFEKSLVPYDGFVYDVELERNHILLTRRNGKVVWGSNCLCISDAILLPREKFKDYLGGAPIDERHLIKGVPKNALDYLNDNAKTIRGYKNTPYFIQDNFKFSDGKYIPKVSAAPKQSEKILEKVTKELRNEEDLTNEIKDLASRNPEYFVRGFRSIQVTNRRGVNGYTNMNGLIRLKQPIMNDCISGINNIKKGIPTTLSQETALSTLHHEIIHNANKIGNMKLTKLQERYMELSNEFVSRNRLPEFMSNLGGKLENKSLMIDRVNTGYNRMVKNFDKLIELSKADKSAVLADVEKHLINESYKSQADGLINSIVKHSKVKIGKLQARQMIKGATQYSEEGFVNFLYSFKKKN